MKPTFNISIDDGGYLDLKVATLLDKYKLKGLFYIPNCCDLTNEEINTIARKHDIGGHTVTHPSDLKLLSPEQLNFEINENKRWLQSILLRSVDYFCYPRGRYNDKVIMEVINAGYKGARTTVINSIAHPHALFAIETTAHVCPIRPEYKESGKTWLQHTREHLEKVIQYGGRFELWGHSEEIDRFDQWQEFEEALRLISEARETTHSRTR